MDRMTRKKGTAKKKATKTAAPITHELPKLNTDRASMGPTAGSMPDPRGGLYQEGEELLPDTLEEAHRQLRQYRGYVESTEGRVKNLYAQLGERDARLSGLRRAADRPLRMRTVQRLVTYQGDPGLVEQLIGQSLNEHQQYELQGVVVTVEQVSDTRRNITPGGDRLAIPSQGQTAGPVLSGRYSGASNIRERQ
jgi:hypothetical protein